MIKKKFNYNNLSGWLFVTPAVLLIAAFMLFPIFESIRLSFFNWNGWQEQKFVGLANYIEMFTEDKYFIVALRNSLIFQFGSTFFQIIVGLTLAILIDLKVKFWKAYRVIFFLPYVLSTFAVSLLQRTSSSPFNPVSFAYSVNSPGVFLE